MVLGKYYIHLDSLAWQEKTHCLVCVHYFLLVNMLNFREFIEYKILFHFSLAKNSDDLLIGKSNIELFPNITEKWHCNI